MKSHLNIHFLKFMDIYQGWQTITLRPAALFVYRVLFKHSHAHYFCIVHGCLLAIMAELSNCHREGMAHKPSTYRILSLVMIVVLACTVYNTIELSNNFHIRNLIWPPHQPTCKIGRENISSTLQIRKLSLKETFPMLSRY